MDVPSPAIDPAIERLGAADRLARIAAILAHDVEERCAPLVIGQEPVQIAADRAPAAAADLDAALEHYRRRIARRLAAAVMDLVAGERSAGDGPEAHEHAFLHALRRLEDRPHRQEPESPPAWRAALRAGAILEVLAQHLIAAT